MKTAESLQNISTDGNASGRHGRALLFRSARKPKKSVTDDTISMTSIRLNKDNRSSRAASPLRMVDVLPNSNPFDDSISVIDGLLQESVPSQHCEALRDTIGRKHVVILKKMVKLEKSHRVESKVLVLTPYRCQLLGVKPPFKLEADIHYLDIKSMDSPSSEKLTISTKPGKNFVLQMIDNDDADHIIGRVALSLRTIFPHVSLARILKATLEPPNRQQVIQNLLNQADQSEPGPCGNFSEMYRCICDYLNATVREVVIWDVDTIYLSQNCRKMNLSDFDLPDVRDVIPIISVMVYNRWFDGLIVRNIKLNSETLDIIIKIVRSSENLKELVLDNVGLKGDFAQRLSAHLLDNKHSSLEVLDLSNNFIDDKGLIHISGVLPLIKQGSIQQLTFSKSGLTSKGINGLCQSIRSSSSMLSSLTKLDLSGNSIKTEEAEGLYSFLSNENHVTDLDLSATDCSVDAYIAAMAKGCTKHLKNLKLGRNPFHGKKKESISTSSIQEFFQKVTSLKFVDFSYMKFPAEALRCLMNGLLHNTNSDLQIELILANCELRSAGGQVLQSTIASATNITKLDISENSFDIDMITLLNWIQQNRSIRELWIGKNFNGIKPKYLKKTMEALVDMIEHEDSCLESLSLADSRLKEYLITFFSCLGSNTSLTSLDISGNLIGDSGSRVLAKSIQINSNLKILKLDRNNFSAVGFNELACAMESNFTLRFIPYPVIDAVASMKHYPDRTQNALSRIQDLLLRNVNANHATNEQRFRLQKVVTNSAQQFLDKLSVKVDENISSLEALDSNSSASSSVSKAKGLVKDAYISRQLLTDLYGLANEKTSGHNSVFQEKIGDIAKKMDELAQEHYQEIVNAMLRNAESQCPHLFELQDIEQDLRSCVDQRCPFPPGSVQSDVVKTAGTDLMNRMGKLNLTIAKLIFDEVSDKLLDALSQSNSVLTEKLNEVKTQEKSETALDKTSIDGIESREVANGVSQKPAGNEQNDGSSSSELLPKIRKERAQSIAKRRQRPVASPTSSSEETSQQPPSIVVGNELKISEDGASVISNQTKEEDLGDDREETLSTTSKDLLETDDEFLDDEPSEVLDHITKARPRGPNRRKRKQNKHESVLEDDVDDFFDKTVTNTDFSETPTLQEEEELKKKEKFFEKRNKTISGMGFPMVGLGALKKHPRHTARNDDNDDEQKSEENDKEESSSKAPINRPKTMMAMPGMGFGNDFFAEMKKKKLNKRTEGGSPKKQDKKLKKSKQDNANNNNNNSSPEISRPSPKARRSMLFDRGDEESNSEKTVLTDMTKQPLIPPKLNQGKLPPPLPAKPKPSLLKPGHEGKHRPASESHDSPTSLPPRGKSSSFRSGNC